MKQEKRERKRREREAAQLEMERAVKRERTSCESSPSQMGATNEWYR